jgi:hypothetical protein
VRPTAFVEGRIQDISTLYRFVEQASVQFRGWDFPHIDRNESPQYGLDWVGQDTDWEHHLESWRLYQSGQFVHFCGFWDDWRDRSRLWPPEENWKPGRRLGIDDTLFRFTEIFEFAARLAMTPAGDESMRVSVTLKNLSDRALFVDATNRMPFRQQLKTAINEFPFVVNLTRAELVSRSRDQALHGAIELFKRFGWDASPEVLSKRQVELGQW